MRSYTDRGIRWSPEHRLTTKEDVINYITTKAKKNQEGCLIWVGYVTGRERSPRLMWNKKYHRARRLLLELMKPEEYKPKWIVTSTCGNNLCVNPDHLIQMSKAAHNRKMAKEGLMPLGKERSIISMLGHADRTKLGLHRAREVVDLRLQGAKLKDIGAIYGVSESAVSGALRRWRNTGVI